MEQALLSFDTAAEDAGERILVFRNVFFAQAALIFVVSAIVFISLRSTQYLAVDGAIRALEVYRNPHPFVHGNNHLLYPIDILEWTCLLQALGISPLDPFQFMADAQAMNAVAAASCLAMFYLFCCAAT